MSAAQAPRRQIDKSRWPRLSPLLDELLDLSAGQRPARLAELQAQGEDGAELAADLRELLWRQDAMDAANYLATPALQTMEAQQPEPGNSAGQQIGAYSLEREIGQGGMGTVWLARRTDGRFDGQVAIKFLNAGLLGRGDAGRFAREGQILARLAHPHIARLLDAGISKGDGGAEQPYLVLEYVDGLPLDLYCDKQALSARARVALFQDVLAAVAHAHTRLILHRDLKPSNILVTSAGEVKLLDFGIAKLLQEDGASEAAATELTRQAGRAFTPRYAAPEQVQGLEVSTATDVYALGVLLYLLLSGGQHPTTLGDEEQTTPLEKLRTLVEVAPKKLSDQVAGNKPLARELRGDLDTIVAKALKKLPAERYANAAELAEDLRRWLNHEPIGARPDSAAYIFAKFLRRHRVAVAAGSLGLLTLSVSVGVALLKGREAQAQRVQAEGLIEFMLGDLRKKLEPVGRLDVLDAVGEKALGYYAQQQLAKTDADSLGRRARALHLMGEIAEKRGQMAEAEQRFAQAAESTAELLARDPKSTQRLFDHAQSSYWLGYAAWQQRRMPQAEAGFQRYLSLAKELVELEPEKLAWHAEQASANSSLGVLKLREGQVSAAMQYFESAREIWQHAVSKDSKFGGELATTLGWIADAQQQQGLFDESIASHQAKLSALNQGEDFKTKPLRAEQSRAATDEALSTLHLSAGRHEEAAAAARRSVSSFNQLSTLDPDNLDMLARLSFARQALAEVLLAQGELKSARDELALVNDGLARLLKADSRKPAWRIQLAGRLLVANLSASASQAELLIHRRELASFLETLAANREPIEMDVDAQWTLGYNALRLGDAFNGMAGTKVDTDTAQRYWDQSLRYSTALVKSPELRVNCLRAHALKRLGRSQEANIEADKLASSNFRHPLYFELMQGLQKN